MIDRRRPVSERAGWERVLGFLIAWTGVAALTVLLAWLGRGVLAAPPLLQPHRIPAWYDRRGAAVAAFASARALLFGVGCYLCVLWPVVVVVRVLGAPRVPPVLSMCRLPGSATLLRLAMGASIAGGAMAATAGSASALTTVGASSSGPTAPTGGADQAPVLRYAGPATPAPAPAPGGSSTSLPSAPATSTPATTAPATTAPATSTPTTTAPVTSAPATSSPATPAPATPSPAPSTPGASSPASSPPASGPPSSAPALSVPAGGTPAADAPAGRSSQSRSRPPPSATPNGGHTPGTNSKTTATARPGQSVRAGWVVQPGDNLWSIANAALIEAWGQPPPESVLGQYWWQVVETNRPHLPDPDDPNLLFAGDWVILPPPPPPAG